jgi:transcriptional regulator with XRE-family HTH domain
MQDEGRQRLAQAVQHRRQQLGYSVRTAADASGLARGTWTALEDGSRRTTDNNYAAIEETLGWAPGSITRTLAGGQPTETGTTADLPTDEAVCLIVDSDLPDDAKKRLAQVIEDDRAATDRRRLDLARTLIDTFLDTSH